MFTPFKNNNNFHKKIQNYQNLKFIIFKNTLIIIIIQITYNIF